MYDVIIRKSSYKWTRQTYFTPDSPSGDDARRRRITPKTLYKYMYIYLYKPHCVAADLLRAGQPGGNDARRRRRLLRLHLRLRLHPLLLRRREPPQVLPRPDAGARDSIHYTWYMIYYTLYLSPSTTPSTSTPPRAGSSTSSARCRRA